MVVATAPLMVRPAGVGGKALMSTLTSGMNAPLALNCSQATFQSSYASKPVTSPASAATASVPKPQADGGTPSGSVYVVPANVHRILYALVASHGSELYCQICRSPKHRLPGHA